jgi:hypothetical protein
MLQEAPEVVHDESSCETFTFGYANREMIVNTNSEFKDFTDKWLRCDGYEPVPIDFESKTLLGSFVIGGCSADEAFNVLVRR